MDIITILGKRGIVKRFDEGQLRFTLRSVNKEIQLPKKYHIWCFRTPKRRSTESPVTPTPSRTLPLFVRVDVRRVWITR